MIVNCRYRHPQSMQQVSHPAIIYRGKHIIRRLLQPLRLCPQRHGNARVRVGRSAALLAVSPPTELSLKRESSHTALEISNAKKNLTCFGRNSSGPCCHRRCVASTLQKACPCRDPAFTGLIITYLNQVRNVEQILCIPSNNTMGLS